MVRRENGLAAFVFDLSSVPSGVFSMDTPLLNSVLNAFLWYDK